jgi:hypothetical protein
MPIFNTLKLWGADVTAQVLEPGETLIDMGSLHEPLNGDESRLGLEDHELSRRERKFLAETGHRFETSDSWLLGIDLSGVHINQDRVHRAMSGLSGIGAPGSIAGQMWRAGRRDGFLEWAVTDRRLLILRKKAGKEHTFLYAVPRSSVAGAVRRGKLLFEWGRVELSFTDGSMLAYVAGFLDIGAARKLVAALSGPIQRGMRDE